MSIQWLILMFFAGAIILAVDVTRRAVSLMIKENNERKLRQAMRRLRNPHLPRATVLVYGKNQAEALEKTVRQVRRSRYGSYDIVVVDDRSTDDTAVRIKKYIGSLKGGSGIQLLQRRADGTKMDAYRAAYRKSRRGEIIICLNAGDEVDSLLIKRVVASRGERQKWEAKTSIREESEGLDALIKGLRKVYWNHPAKIRAYAPTALRRSEKEVRDMNVRAVATGIQMALLAILLIGIATWGFITLWYAWILCSLYTLALIWIQYEVPASQKWKFSFSVPSALFLIPVATVVQGVLQLRIRK